MERLLTLQEVSTLLGSNDPTGRYVRDLRQKGKLIGAKFGNKLMFRESEVEEFIDREFKKQNR